MIFLIDKCGKGSHVLRISINIKRYNINIIKILQGIRKISCTRYSILEQYTT